MLYYRNQDNGKALISSVNRLAGEKDAVPRRSARALRSEPIGGRPLALRETAPARPGRATCWCGSGCGSTSRTTANNYVGKLWQAQAKLLLARRRRRRRDAVGAVRANSRNEARAALRAFLDAQPGADRRGARRDPARIELVRRDAQPCSERRWSST